MLAPGWKSAALRSREARRQVHCSNLIYESPQFVFSVMHWQFLSTCKSRLCIAENRLSYSQKSNEVVSTFQVQAVTGSGRERVLLRKVAPQAQTRVCRCAPPSRPSRTAPGAAWGNCCPRWKCPWSCCGRHRRLTALPSVSLRSPALVLCRDPDAAAPGLRHRRGLPRRSSLPPACTPPSAASARPRLCLPGRPDPVMLQVKTKDQKLTYDLSEQGSRVREPLFIIIRKLS